MVDYNTSRIRPYNPNFESAPSYDSSNSIRAQLASSYMRPHSGIGNYRNERLKPPVRSLAKYD